LRNGYSFPKIAENKQSPTDEYESEDSIIKKIERILEGRRFLDNCPSVSFPERLNLITIKTPF
jgi:hypothetical protein